MAVLSGADAAKAVADHREMMATEPDGRQSALITAVAAVRTIEDRMASLAQLMDANPAPFDHATDNLEYLRLQREWLKIQGQVWDWHDAMAETVKALPVNTDPFADK